MYLWNTRALASQLRSGELLQAERFKYLFTSAVLTTSFYELSRYDALRLTAPAIIDTLIIICATIVGIYWSYLANKAGDNKEFIDRYICLGLPIAIRLILAFIAIIIACNILGYIVYGKEYKELSVWIDVALSAGFTVTFYWRLIHHMKKVAQSKTD